jgi:hypothetical protein
MIGLDCGVLLALSDVALFYHAINIKKTDCSFGRTLETSILQISKAA